MFWTIVMSALVVFWIGFFIVGRRRLIKPAEAKGPRDLFLDLCRVHRLSRTQRSLLETVISDSKPEEMCRVFVDPSYLNHLALAPSPNSDSYRELARMLFGGRGH